MKARTQHAFFEARRGDQAPLVLVTVVETGGSTYSKAGARMLVDGEGRFHGMLSGGCLEGDLAMRARVAIESGAVQYASYNLAADDDELWGMGVGCDGEMRVMLQPLFADRGYQPYASISAVEGGERPALVVVACESGGQGIEAGATIVATGDKLENHGFDDAGLDAVSAAMDSGVLTGESPLLTLSISGQPVKLLCQRLLPLPRLLVLGAGLDAEPLVRLAAELGWRCTVADHRPAYVEGNDFALAERVLSAPADAIANELQLDTFDLAVVMSHHLVSDRSYLRQLAGSRIPYIGLLGPPGRRDRLLNQLGDVAARLDGRLHGPAGLNLGGRGPAAIALSILAEMQQQVSRSRSQAGTD